jgi:hypothetical protein
MGGTGKHGTGQHDESRKTSNPQSAMNFQHLISPSRSCPLRWATAPAVLWTPAYQKVWVGWFRPPRLRAGEVWATTSLREVIAHPSGPTLTLSARSIYP